MRTTIVLLVCLCCSGPASAQVDWNVEVEGNVPGVPLPSGLVPIPVAVGAAALTQCAGISYAGLSASASYNTTTHQVSTSTSINVAGAVSALTNAIAGSALNPTVTICQQPIVQDLGHVSGNLSLYTFHIGPGGPNVLRATTSLSIQDTIEVYSTNPGPVVIEIPVGIDASVVAAESFGDVNQTFARATLTAMGSVAGQSVPPTSLFVESVSVIPTMDALQTTIPMAVTVPAGLTTIPVNLDVMILGEASAQGTGLFGLISGSATLGVMFPNSLTVGALTGVGGGALPSDLLVVSQTTGMVYADTRSVKLQANNGEISLATGGTQSLMLSGATAAAGNAWYLLGSATAPDPGFRVAGLFIPLEPDAYFTLRLGRPPVGLVDAAGNGVTSLPPIPPGLPPTLEGFTVWHAAALPSPLLVTSPVALRLIP